MESADECVQNWNPQKLLVEMENGVALRQSLAVLKKLEIGLPYNPVILLLGTQKK